MSGQALAQDAERGSFEANAADAPAVDLDDLDQLLAIAEEDLAQLSQIRVTAPALEVEVSSVTRSESTVGKSPAAVFVITPEMIRRSGATSIPEVLRMVPGLSVARIDGNKWAVSSRGFNNMYANKMLVLVDGRTVYTLTFAGVYWDVQDTLLEDIQRIEVIRGPGATVWGANAVNGVINIVTKNARDTHGTLVTSGGGSEDRAIASARHGGQIAPGLNYRVYGKYFDRAPNFDPAGAADDWHQGRVGFRTDWDVRGCDCDTLTLQGDYYQGRSGQTVTLLSPTAPFSTIAAGDAHVSGVNLLARWAHKVDCESSYSLQAYYDRTIRNELVLEQEVNALDVEWLHRFPLGCVHRITWGLRYRRVEDLMGLANSFQFGFTPPSRRMDLYSAFVQDQITLVGDVLDLTIGSKFEKNDFTGFEIQPTARLLWTLDERRVAWAAVSRAVRTPSRFDEDIRLLFANIAPFPPTFLGLFGNRDLASESLIAYELGFRAQPTDSFSWDLALFFNDYEDLVVWSPGVVVPPPPVLVLGDTRTNGMQGETYGVELSANYALSPCWRVQAAYTYLRMQLQAQPGVTTTAASIEGESPQNQFHLLSSWDLSHNIEFDLIGRYVDNLPAMNVASYISLDARLGWRPNACWEFSVVGQNLLEQHRLESNASGTHGTAIERGVYAQGVWRR